MTGQAVTRLFSPSVVVGHRRPLPLSLAVRRAVAAPAGRPYGSRP